MDNNNIKTSLAFFVIVLIIINIVVIIISINNNNKYWQPHLLLPFKEGWQSDANTINPLTLGNPYFVEYDITTSQKPTVINETTNATEIKFSGHGTAKDIDFTDNGKALIIPRGWSAVLLQGKDNLVSSAGDKASLNLWS